MHLLHLIQVFRSRIRKRSMIGKGSFSVPDKLRSKLFRLLILVLLLLHHLLLQLGQGEPISQLSTWNDLKAGRDLNLLQIKIVIRQHHMHC